MRAAVLRTYGAPDRGFVGAGYLGLMGTRIAAMAVVCALAGAHDASAETFGFLGGNLRTDLATHVLRASVGAERGCWSATLVLDPYGYYYDSQQDNEVFVERDLWHGGWAVLAGWRFESAPVLGVRYYLEKPFVGVSASVPRWLFGVVRIKFAAEIAFTLVEHAPDLPAVWFWEQNGILRNAFDVGFFARFDLARKL